MENLWMILAITYGALKGIRECMKKEALKKSSLMEILFLYMLVGFAFTIPDTKSALSIEPVFILLGFFKAVIVCTGFVLSFIAIRGLPIGFYSIMSLGQMVFTTLLGVIFLKEDFGVYNLIGLTLVVGGLVLVNLKKHGEGSKQIRLFSIAAVLGYTFLNSVSAAMDKVLTKHISPAQLQFWFMFFSVIFYGIIILVKREKVSFKSLGTNIWIPLMGFFLVFGDRLLFMANASQNSKITVMTLLMQCSVIITIILGKVVYREKDFLYRLFCAAVVICGIVVGTL